MDWRTSVSRARQNPKLALRALTALARGLYYRVKYRVLRRRVVIGRRFRVVGRLYIKGPGTVVFGDDCTVISSRIAPTTPYTHSRDAVLKFGDGVMLVGTRFGCQKRIEVGDGAVLADARIMDTDFHRVNVRNTPRSRTGGVGKSISIGRDAWIGAAAIVLKGVSVGENSVVGAGAVVSQDVPPNVVVGGNPARVVRRLSEANPLPIDTQAAVTGVRREP